MSPGCTSATRSVEPTRGAGASTNQAGPNPAHATATVSAMIRPDTPRCRITPTVAVFTATSRKLVSHTPPSEADANVAGWFPWEEPRGPPRAGQHDHGGKPPAGRHRGRQQPLCGPPPGQPQRAEPGGQHRQQRTG